MSGILRCFAPKYVILYLRVLCFQRLLAIPRPASLGEVVHGGELNEGRKDESVADGYEPIHGCCIGHFRERVPGTDAECGHGQHSGHPWVQTKAVTSLNWVFTGRLETLNKGARFNNFKLLATAVLPLNGLPCVNVHDRNITQINKTLGKKRKWVDKRLHSPKTVLAGTDSLFSQNDTWDRITVMKQGIYVWMTK